MDDHDLDLARRYAPIIYFDGADPFLPSYAGYTLFRKTGPSPSFPRHVVVEHPTVLAVEYALWWDWDIQHLYELEHVWVFVDGAGEVVGAEASQHGSASGTAPRLVSGRPAFFAEPGKHALHVDPEKFVAGKGGIEHSCGRGAGAGGVWITPLYRDRIRKTPEADQLVRTALRRRAFTPSWDWSKSVDVSALPLIPWAVLDAAIPGMVATKLAELEASIPRHERHVLRVGHRGAGVHAAPNTLASIQKVRALGADLVELDLRLSSKGQPILAHDAPDTADEDQAPSLSAALDLCGRLGLAPYLDIKDSGAVEVALAELTRRDLVRYSIIGSSNPAWVARATDRAPHIATSILFSAFEDDPVALARATGARYVHPCWERHPAPHSLLTHEWLDSVRREGLGVITWHEERPEVLNVLLALGVSAICTDRLDLLDAG